jgi:16S rRNA (adenine1518-N6/adenine1519-N6)-dimethyltransferase
MAQGRAEIKSLLEAHGVRPSRRLGQNFLADPNLVDRIVRTAGVGAGDRVVEVGAGTGTLTRALGASGATVVAYEVDQRLLPLLGQVLSGLEVELRFADVTKVDLTEALGEGSWTMVANLPYNVGTPLILDVLRNVPAVDRLIVMVQHEVADRLVAEPGSKSYGLPSVVTRLHTRPRIAFSVPPHVFFPAPEVESAVVELVRIPAPDFAEAAIGLAAAAFQQRRKMLRRSLDSVLEDANTCLVAAGLDPTARPEDLFAEDFVRLARVVA